MSLEGRIIVVTGAARGLGRAFAEACARAGAAGGGRAAVVGADISLELAESTAAGIRAGGGDCVALGVDRGDPASIEAFAREVERRHGHIDGLVNNAAIATGIGGKTYDEIDIETWDRVMNVNVRGT